MKYGLTETTVKKICAVFARFPEIEKAVLYGSRAKGNFKTGSDIDLMLYGESIVPDQLSAITSALDDLLLPYTIDLSIFDDLSHAKLREHIERVGVVFYERAKQCAAVKKGWEIKRLGEVCDISTGKWDANHAVENGEFRFFTCAREPMLCNTKRFSGECLVLPGNGVNVGDVYYYKGDFDAYQRTYVISKIKPYPKYLFYHMRAFWKERNLNKQYGSATNFLKIGNFNEYEILLPPLPEQKRIVGILDKAFAAISMAKENAEKNLANTKELFNNYLQSVFTNKSNGWKIKQLADVAEYFNGLTYSPKDVSSKGIIVLRSSNVQNDELDFSDIVRVNCPVKEKIMVKDGDILMCSRNGSKRLVGKTAGIQNLKEAMTFGTFMMVIRSQYNPYLTWFFKSNEFRMQISRGENTMINQITRYMLDDISISFPPPEEQKAIVKKIVALSAETKKLEAIYTKKLADLDELKKSVLHKAFNGAL